jgi:hypothetical protein
VRLARFLFLFGMTAVAAIVVSSLMMVIWPGAMKATGPLLCPEDQQDEFVVRYDVQTSDGTGTNFTLFCMSDRGEFTEVGTWEPLLLMTALIAAGMFGGVLLWLGTRLIRGGRSEPAPPPDPLADAVAQQPNPISD